jgi:membrane protease YdiL (CAAX protease family)
VIPAPPPGARAELPPPRPDLADPVVAARPAVTWGWLEAIGIFVIGYIVIASVLAGAIVFTIAGIDDAGDLEGSLELVLTIVVDVVFIGLMIAWLSRRHPGWVRALGVPAKGARLRAIAWGAGMGVLLYPTIAIVIGIPFSLLLEAISGEQATTPDQLPAELSVGGQVLAVVLAVFAAPLMEELFYRGVLFRSIRDRHGFWVGALISAVVFGAVHYVASPWQDALLLQSVMVFTGFAFAWIYERGGTIVGSIAAHTVFNMIGVTLILSGAA